MTPAIWLRNGLATVLCGFSACAWAADLSDGQSDTPAEVVEDRWVFEAIPYFWGASLGGKTTAGDSISMPFHKILEELNIGVMASVSAEKGRFGLYSDLIYLNLSNTETTSANIVGNTLNFRMKANVQGVISTNAAGYRLIDTPNTKLTGFGGFRYLWLDTELDFTVGGLGAKAESQVHTFDGVVGLRGHTNLSERWLISYYGDIGAGQSDLTFQAFGGLGYKFKHFDAVVGYRYLDWRSINDSTIDDLNIHGPMIGAKFRF